MADQVKFHVMTPTMKEQLLFQEAVKMVNDAQFLLGLPRSDYLCVFGEGKMIADATSAEEPPLTRALILVGLQFAIYYE